jgi:hypothetical protein
MSNNKQSSVEWLVKKLADLTFNYIAGFLTKKEYDTQCNKVIEQAKAMHKEEMIQNCAKMQIIDDVDFDGNVTFIFDPEQYYEQTYGGNNG